MAIQFSLYLHIPFCRHRCAYCDFNTYAGQDHLRAAYVNALCQEAGFAARSAGEPLPVGTIFFGGGTPSLLSTDEFEKILSSLRANFEIDPAAEISLEANPGTVSAGQLVDLRRLGFNRISLGMQSAHPDDLRLLERQHGFAEVVQAVKWSRQAGFDNLNLDLIFGIPEQSLPRWRDNLERALDLTPEHLSLYALTVEHGTPFQHWTDRGLVPLADQDLAADMYEYAEDHLEQAGYEHYEISNWARLSEDGTSLTCRHNLQYWRGLPYLGLGAGAHGYAGGYRTANVLGISAYIERCRVGAIQAFPGTPATVSFTPVDRSTEIQETMMMGLRLLEEGVSSRQFQDRFNLRLPDLFEEKISRLIHLGLLEWAGRDADILRLTRRGHLLGNQVFMEFVGEELGV